MLKDLKTIMLKEIKEILRDPHMFIGMILVPLLMFPLLGMTMVVSTEMMMPSEEIRIGVLNLDQGNVSKIFVEFLKEVPNITVVDLNEKGISNVDDAKKFCIENGILVFIVVPKGFSDNMLNGRPVIIDIYAIMEEHGKTTDISNAFSVATEISRTAFDKTLSYLLVGDKGSGTYGLVYVNPKTIVKGNVLNASPDVISGIYFSQVFTIPLILMVLLIFVVQIAAVSIASEKEQKTLETLLSLPVDRKMILLGKLTGSIIVAIVGALGYLVGFNLYISMVTSKLAEDVPMIRPEDVGFAITPVGYIILGITIFLTILVVLSMAIIIAAPAEDIRGAQSISGFLILPMVVFSIFLAFASFEISEELKLALVFIPFATPTITTIELMSGKYWIPLVGIVAMLIEAVIFLYVATWFFTSEKLITMRITLGRKREVIEEE
ncbi:MAG: ABC transporter permease [Candidatus Baldrarchaeia archaeon]